MLIKKQTEEKKPRNTFYHISPFITTKLRLQTGLFHEDSRRLHKSTTERKINVKQSIKFPEAKLWLHYFKKAQNIPKDLFTSFKKYTILYLSSIETLYSIEDISFQQVFIIREQIHHLCHRTLCGKMDHGNPKDIICKFPDEGQIIL